MGSCGQCNTVNKKKYVLKEKIKEDIQKLETEIKSNENQIIAIDNAINKTKEIIINKIDNEDDYNINNEINEYNEKLIKKNENNQNLKFLKSKINNLNQLSEKMVGDGEKIINDDKGIKDLENKYNSISKSIGKFKKSAGDKNLNNLIDLKENIIKEIKGINNRKQNLINNFNNIKNEFVYITNSIQGSINENLNNIDMHYDNFSKKLNEHKNRIKTIIKDILDNKIDSTKTKSIYENIKNDFQTTKSNQKNTENDILEKRKKDILASIIKNRKNDIYSRLNNIKNYYNQINNIKNKLDENITKINNEINLLNEKEKNINSKEYYISYQLKMIEDIKKYIENLNNLRNCLINKRSILLKIINDYNKIEQCNLDNYLENDKYYNRKINEINNLKIEMEKGINNNNTNIDNIKSNYEKLDEESNYIIKLSFNNNYNKDQTYVKLRQDEEKSLIKLYNDNIASVEYIFLNNNIYNIPILNDDIIHQIFINENSEIYCKNKIIKEIESIIKEDNKFKIENLNILLVGGKGVGKTELIYYMLDLNRDEKNNVQNKNLLFENNYPSFEDVFNCSVDDEDIKINNNYNNDFKVYTSQKIKYLKLIEVQGIGYDEDSTPENIGKKIKNYIDDLINYNSQNYNNVIHCIWYCISGDRFQKSEKILLNTLKNMYKDNIIPIILVFTKSIDESLAIEMSRKFKEDNINNSFVEVIAKDIPIKNGKINAFGKDKLMKTTLVKCKEALESDMMKIMIEQISNNIVQNLIKETENIIDNIKKETIKYFIGYYRNVLNNGDFIEYIVDIYFKYLNKLYDEKKKITNKSKNLLIQSDFISTINDIYSSFKQNVNNIIQSIIIEKSKELLNIQATMEKKFGNMEILNKRNYNEFMKTSEIFLKKNYYFIFQNYLINMIIKKSDYYFNNFLLLISEEFKTKIQELGILNDNIEIRSYLEYCFKIKLTAFSKNNLFLINNSINDEPLINNIQSIPIISQNNNIDDEEFNNLFKNSNSFIIDKKIDQSFNQNIIINNINNNWLIQENDNWKFLNKNLMEKFKNFIKEIKYQEKSLIIDNNDKNYILLLSIMKKHLLYFLSNNIINYFSEINTYFEINSYFPNLENIEINYNYSNLLYNDNEIESIIRNENIEEIYKIKIHNELSKYIEKEKDIYMKCISIIITGKSGVGKSTLINCMFKVEANELAKEGVYDVTTQNISSYTNKNIPFLNLTDTRGYELKETYSPDKIKNEVLQIIKFKNLDNNFNNHIQCIYFCVNGPTLDDTEKKALKELNNNEFNIPLIVVYTRAFNEDEIKKMKNEIENLLPGTPFIDVLVRKINIKEKEGLDNLLDMTINCIKKNDKNEIFGIIKNEYYLKEKKYINDMISQLKINIIEIIVEEIINNYIYVKNEKDFEEYIYNLIEIIIMKFSFKNEISPNTKIIIQNAKNDIKMFIQSYIQYYSNTAEKYINMILDNESLEFLDIQVKIEKSSKISINQKNKRNREEFKELIFQFLKDNFDYIAQKYLIYIFTKEIFADLIEKIGSNILGKLDNILSSKEIIDDYKNIYLKIIDDFEKEIDKYRGSDKKIYTN